MLKNLAFRSLNRIFAKRMTNEEYIAKYREEDVRRLALKRAPEGVDLKWCLQQIEGWQLARHKLPRWAATEGLWYPARLSMEQCSSEQTADYKRQVVERLLPEGERQRMVDLTGGLGVDFAAMAPLFDEAVYVEILPELRRLAEHNMAMVRDDTLDNLIKSITTDCLLCILADTAPCHYYIFHRLGIFWRLLGYITL